MPAKPPVAAVQATFQANSRPALRSDTLYVDTSRPSSTSYANKELIRQLEQRPDVIQALHYRKRSVMQRLGAKARLGNQFFGYRPQPYMFKRAALPTYMRVGRRGGYMGYRGFPARRRNFGSPLQLRPTGFAGFRNMRGGRRGMSMRRGRGGPAGRLNRNQPRVSKEDLDRQIDAYMAHTKTSLDAQLDSYMDELKAEIM